jgi:molybdopterin converting factor small subunit
LPNGVFGILIRGIAENVYDRRPVSVTIHLPAALRRYCNGLADVPVQAATVRAALSGLETTQPALYRNLCDERGGLRRHLNVFVNSSHMRDRNGLDTPLSDGDVVTILAAVSGG